MSINYAVVVEKYAERHFIANFKKKYKRAWDVTWAAIHEELKRVDILIDSTKVAEVIATAKEIRIVKTEFRVHGTQESRHASGNRCIAAIHNATATVHVLLIYNKNDLSDGNETAQWKALVKENYREYVGVL